MKTTMNRHGCATVKSGRSLVVESAHVEERQRRQDVILAGHVVLMDAVDGVPLQGTLGENRPLGVTRRAGCIDDEQRRV